MIQSERNRDMVNTKDIDSPEVPSINNDTLEPDEDAENYLQAVQSINEKI